MRISYTTKESRLRDKKFLPLLRKMYRVDPIKGCLFNRKTGQRVGKPANADAYGGVGLRVDDKVHFFNTHRVIWLLCKGLVPIGYTLNHKNGIKSISKLKNLECITALENREHAIITGLQKYAEAQDNGSAKLTNNQVLRIREIFSYKKRSKRNYKIIAQRVGVHHTTIRNVVNKVYYSSV